VAFASSLFWSSSALAQSPNFVLDRLLPPGGPDDGIVMPRAVVQPDNIVFGQLGFGGQINPLRTRTVVNTSTDSPVIKNQPGFITSQLSWYPTVGVQILNRASFSVSVPFYYTAGQNPNYGLAPPDTMTTPTPVNTNSAGLGDIRLDLRAVALRTKNERGALGGRIAIMIPASDGRGPFVGDANTSWIVGVQGEYDFKYFILAGDMSLQLGRGTHSINNPGGGSGLGVGDEWRWAVAGFVPIKGGKFRVGVNFMGQVGIQSGADIGDTFNGKRNLPLEWSAEGRMKLGPKERLWIGVQAGTLLNVSYGAPDFRAVGVVGMYWPITGSGANSPDAKLALRDKWKSEHGQDTDGDGIPDDIDACPSEPEDHLGQDQNDGCPLPPDKDGDGVPDMYDKCPDVPEDKDGIQDGDGCPEDDADKDGIPDTQDKCPTEPGKPSVDPTKNGCPTFISYEGNVVRILQQVHFQTGSATILPDSFPMLQEIVNLLKVNPQIKRMSVDGHTDNKGAADMNMKLSSDRAASVKQWLTEHGVEEKRTESHGYGMTKPIESNDTDKGRAANRRVEFKIVDQDDPNKYKKP
jgi:outer membrane protein OmpA-like peptidoglycan-associated protein